jgi:PAS domain S-box-containing protein
MSSELNPANENVASYSAFQENEELFHLMVDSVQDYAIYMLDASGHIRSWNAGAERFKGYKAVEVIGRHFSIFYTKDDIAQRKPEMELDNAIAEGHFEDEGWRVRKDGSRFWANVVLTALKDRTGRLRGFSKVTRDITARKEAEEILRVSEERFRMMVTAVQDYAIYMLSADGEVMSWNVGAERLKGYRAEEIVGNHFRG